MNKSYLFFPAILISTVTCHAMSEQPINFSWLTEGKICGMARPKKAAHIKWLEENNVGLVVTLTGEGKLPDVFFEKSKLNRLYIPIEDYHIPTFEQVDLFINQTTKAIETGKAIAVHCAGGKGRTGTMLACWLVAKENMNPEEAIAFVRKQRPGSVETEEQEAFVRDYFEYFKTK
jgi:atypical dual specificity phosphatase